MTPPPSIPGPDVTHSVLETASSNAVLDRVAHRVRQRLMAEQAATSRIGDGAHAASLIWPWPF
ncbi:HaaA family cyclophane-containing RiPP peptide [Streptomyces sp. NPDC050546]|uniref:HaaA family cyclophane-containing RiPP peptide n=1 Tax=Streptomyces sp. NPDC050546 TaxID=3365628 RepID=UPI0037BAF85C